MNPKISEPRRLERVLAQCETVSRRYSWARAFVILAGVGATWGAGTVFGAAFGWVVFIAAATVFALLVFLHRRLDYWSTGFRILQSLYLERAARKALDWDNIPLPSTKLSNDFSPLALDLDLTGTRSLHHLLDTSISRQGSQMLADWLTVGTPNPPQIAVRQAVVGELAGLPRFRTRLTLLFRRLSRDPLDGDLLVRWLLSPFPKEQLRRIIPWAVLLAVLNACLIMLWSGGVLPPVWIASTLAYSVVYFGNRPFVEEFLSDVVRLDRELSKFQPLLHYLERFSYGSRGQLKKQCTPFWQGPDFPTQRLRQVKFVTALVGLRTNQVLGPLLNLLFAWDFLAAWLAANQRQVMARLLPLWLDTFHELEALMALSEYASLHPDHSFPTIKSRSSDPSSGSEPVLKALRLGHPLLLANRKVCNDVQFNSLGELWIVTGSNMAGKSTFIRTLGINLCLAYAGGPVDAAEFQTEPFRLYTCIRISDSLGDGFSYFYAEVKRLKGLLDALHSTSSGMPLLYLVDEIFRGTNNRERLIGSRAYVRALIGAPGVGLIATHDLELAALADKHSQARNVHFRDQVADGKLIFDYRLRSGPSPTTNALTIMALEGLPVHPEK